MGDRHSNLIAAKVVRNGEFYTRYSDVGAEVSNYPGAFSGRSVHLNCDDPHLSQFFRYFVDHFDALGLSRITCTCWDGGEDGFRIPWRAVVTGVPTGFPTGSPGWIERLLSIDGNSLDVLRGNGSFDSPEVLDVTRRSDVVVTNPPFPEARRFLDVLTGIGVDLLVILPLNVAGYRDVFPLFRDGRLWMGVTRPKDFDVPGGGVQHFGNVRWMTTLDHPRRHVPMDLLSTYDPNRHPRYDNYDGIDVGRVSDIPSDWAGDMGVPLTFMDGYCPEQFELVGADGSYPGVGPMGDWLDDARAHGNPAHYSKNMRVLVLHDSTGFPRKPYKRIIIRPRRLESSSETTDAREIGLERHMPTLPVTRGTVQMNGEDHTFLQDDRFSDFANQAYGFLAEDLSPESVFHVIELAMAYEYDCTQADISGKPEKWVVS